MERNEKLKANAQQLRKNMTKEEAKLWYQFLCRYPSRFRRQYVIGNYITDFYCHTAKLVVELDGSQHFDPAGMAHDAARTAFLEGYGLTVIRIPNNEVTGNCRGVCEFIHTAVTQQLP